MTQSRDGISLAPEEGARVSGVASRFSVMAAMLAIASLIAGSAGTSYAHKKNPSNIVTLDTVVVTNYGAAFSGSVSTYLAGSGKKARPNLQIRGTNTGLGNSSGAAHDAVSSADGHIAVAVPFDNFGGVDFKGDISGCGPFGVILPTGVISGTGMVEIYSPGANGNSSPENIICSPNFAFGAPNTTGIFLPQGVAFESPFDGVNPGTDILAVANNFPIVLEPVGSNDLATCKALGLPTAATGALGSVTEYDASHLATGIDNIPPFNAVLSVAVNPLTLATFHQNVTIGGCLTLMAGPEELVFDDAGVLYVVNNAGSLAAASAALPRFVTVYPPGASGDQFPIAVIGVGGPTPVGTFLQPVGIAVESAPSFMNDIIFVTDQGDNSIKVFKPFTNFGLAFFQGQLIATIQGGATHLSSPEGVALALHTDNNTLYVVNQMTSTLEMFTDIDATVAGGGGNVPPTLIVKSKHDKLLQPVGVAKPQFTPSSAATPPPGITAASE